MPTYLVDTGPIIRHLRGQQSTIRLLRTLGGKNRLAISTITRVEIISGMRTEEEYPTQRLLRRFINIDMDRNIADRAGQLVRALRKENRALEIPDAIIAATALQYGMTLVTFNLADFEIVPSISLYPLGEN